MAVLLKEEGLHEKAQIYATDFNENVIKKAKEGIFSVENMKQYIRNYKKAGGEESFADYYTTKYDNVILDRSLKKRILFSDHNLVTDGVFGEMDMILCRNVLIYFNRELQNRVLRLFCNSLRDGGFLCLGSKETIMFSDCSCQFDAFVEKEKIYKKKVQ